MSYKRIGDFIELVDERNKDLSITKLLGLSISKQFIPSVANTIGTNMKTYKIIRKNQFACSVMQVRRDGKMPVALLKEFDEAIISQAYPVFQVIDETELLPDYLMMWFTRSEFDRQATFHAVGGVRGSLEWEDFLDFELPIPSIEKQQQIVAEYNTVTNRINLNNQLNQKLEETAQALYKHWFVDFEFPNTENKPYKSSGGKMVFNEELEKDIPVGWSLKRLNEISKITMGQSPSGETYNELGVGEVFYQGRTDFGFRLPTIRSYTTEPKRIAKKGDILMSVRAPVGDLNIANTDCCIGRGISSIRSIEASYTFYLMKNFKKLFDSSKGTGTIFSSINKDELFDLKIIYNKEIAIFFNNKINKVDKSIYKNCEQIVVLQEFQSLLLAKMTQQETKLQAV
ncbi:restriction endonuclease subunit S [Flavicella sp.]|uniref:restriction endonuclease subunit S n=1 Tax=Flavicella sp. TaxID=2957742 RepID=UPI00301750AD